MASPPFPTRFWTLFLAGLSIPILTGIWVNLLTAMPPEQTWLAKVEAMGWNHMWLLLGAGVAVWEIWIHREWEKKDLAERRAMSSRLDDLQGALLRNMLHIAVEAIRALQPTIRINARYFYAKAEGGRT